MPKGKGYGKGYSGKAKGGNGSGYGKPSGAMKAGKQEMSGMQGSEGAMKQAAHATKTTGMKK